VTEGPAPSAGPSSVPPAASAAPTRAGPAPSRERARAQRREKRTRAVVARRARRPPDLDGAATRWQLALDAAGRALSAARGSLPGPELERRRASLERERRETAELLLRVARFTQAEPPPWLSPVPVTAPMLGLPQTVRGCLFDLEGVLTDGALLQAWAWATVFDELLHRIADAAGWRFDAFDVVADYRAYLDGRPRLEGIRAFLGSRGVSLPEGGPGDSSRADTAHGLARRKGDVLARRLGPRGVTALGGACRYLQAAGRAGLGRAVLSASSSTVPMLELAGLAALVETRVDGDVMQGLGLRSRPAPDQLLAACRRLGVAAGEVATFTHSVAGVAAGRACAVLTVVGVGDGPTGAVLREAGADVVVPSLAELLDPRLLPSRDR
jgi:beta-phosphoglucomutase-like phosphatase (HAD superfamily)